MDKIKKELCRYNIADVIKIKVISNKDGIIVCEIITRDNSYYLKYFEKNEYKREIEYYRLLRNLGIMTLEIIDSCDSSILMENINKSSIYRLATEEDLKNEKVVIALAKWYRELHQKGCSFFEKNQNINFYSEIKLLNEENLFMVKENSGYGNEYFWSMLKNKIQNIDEFIRNNKTITYNDFYYGNMIVSKDLHEAFMFDYNLLGEGLKYFDISNVLFGLSDKMRKMFLNSYGEYNKIEKNINDILSPIIGLVVAYKRDKFPSWAVEYKEELTSGEILNKLEKFSDL